MPQRDFRKATRMFSTVLAGLLALGPVAFASGDDHGEHDHHEEAVAEVGEIEIFDVLVIRGAPTSPTAAAFFVIENEGDEADRLISASADVAQLVELHTHIDDNGVMKMRPVEAGFEIPAEGMHALKRGADHVMFMGINDDIQDGSEFALTLTFEKAGSVTFDVKVGMDGHEGHNH